MKELPMTKYEVADLEDGTEVIVIWSGGNGPHRYKVKKIGNMVGVDTGNHWEPLDWLGKAPKFTEVHLAP